MHERVYNNFPRQSSRKQHTCRSALKAGERSLVNGCSQKRNLRQRKVCERSWLKTQCDLKKSFEHSSRDMSCRRSEQIRRFGRACRGDVSLAIYWVIMGKFPIIFGPKEPRDKSWRGPRTRIPKQHKFFGLSKLDRAQIFPPSPDCSATKQSQNSSWQEAIACGRHQQKTQVDRSLKIWFDI